MKDAYKRVFDHLATMPRPPELEERRRIYDERFSVFKLADDITITPVEEEDFKGEWLTPPDADLTRAVIYMHGGGYVRGSLKSHRHMVGEIARAAGCPAFHVDYRLAPEHPFPAGLEDVVAAFKHFVAKGITPQKIALGGDSAGSGLVVAAMVMLRDQNHPLPGCGWSLSGWFDLEARGASFVEKVAQDAYVRAEYIIQLAEQYLGDRDRHTPLAAPIYADLADLPPLLLQVGSAEVLLDDTMEFARRAGHANLDVKVEVWPNMQHVWHLFPDWLEEARDAIAAGGAFVKKHTGAAN